MVNIKDPEKLVDEIVDRFEGSLVKQKPIQKLRNSQLVTALTGATGLALFLVGVEKIFNFLNGWESVLLGLLLLAISGALFTKLK